MPKIDEQVFLTGDAYFDRLLADIRTAQTSIVLETYIFANDSLGHQVADALVAAAKRRVKVWVLVDGIGSSASVDAIAQRLAVEGIQFRVFHPLPWRFWHWKSIPTDKNSSIFSKLSYLIAKINVRNHRKSCVIDRQIVYIGSANIHICHSSQAKGGAGWRDTIVRLVGMHTSDLSAAFEMAWCHAGIPERLHQLFAPVSVQTPIRLNNTRRRRRVLYKNLLYRLARARHRVWITNAYFVPDNFLLKRLQNLARAGVDVRILLPQISDVRVMPWASATFYDHLLTAGVRIFEYKPAMLHSKTLIVDQWFLVGSSNLNHRSLLHDLEVDVHLKSPEACAQLEQQFLLDLMQAEEVTLIHRRKRPLYQKWLGYLLLYIKYWI